MEHLDPGRLYWTTDQLTLVAAAVTSAAKGEPTVLVVEGEPGMGKTALLDVVDTQGRDFAVLTAEAAAAVTEPYHVLQQWGVEVAPAADGNVLPAFHAAQLLRNALDALPDQPVLLRLDDAQWADRESLDALSWLMRRAEGDHLLVTLGHRPLPAADRMDWQRRLARMPGVRTLHLSGLELNDAAALAADTRPGLSRETIGMLWEHTEGNPLYLSTLLSEYDAPTLTGMRTLPAPAEFARSVSLRLQKAPESSLTTARAMAVLGLGWLPLLEVAGVARVTSPAQALQSLSETGLVELRWSNAQASARFSHALIRAAIYQQTPSSERQRLHLIAARLAPQTSQCLEHRMAATDQYDDQLAADMESFAVELSARASYRLASHFLQWASAVSSEQNERRRRWLESLLCSVHARDLAAVHAAEGELRKSSDPDRSALVVAALATAESRFDDVLTELTSGAGHTATADARTAFRTLALLAWAQVITGSDNQIVGATLDRLYALNIDDPAFRIFSLLAAGQLQSRLTSPEASLAGVLQLLPGRPAEAADEQSGLLSWRGALRIHTGFLPDGIADLQETQRRMLQSGSADPINGATHAFLGQSYWLHGQWDLARISFQLAVDMAADEQLLPLVLAYLPLDASASGDFTTADRQLAEADSAFARVRWLEAVQAYLIARVVRAHAGGHPGDQGTVLVDLERRWPELPLATGLVGATWLMHAAIATIWAGRLDEASALLLRMTALEPQAPWVPAVVAWLSGLVAERRGQSVIALGHLRAADDAELADLPLYRAHLLADRGRIEHDNGNNRERDQAYDSATAIYAALGASPYLERLARARQSEAAPAHPAWTPNLTDRERDILTLLLRGMSYAQISKELFITSSTVSYHLGNIYSKAGVRSRHQLTQVARQDPQLFGIPLGAGLAW